MLQIITTIFAYAVTGQLSWHVQNCGLITSLQSKWEETCFHEISAVEWVLVFGTFFC